MDMQRPMDAAAVRDDAGKRGWRCKNNVTALESMSCFDRVQILTRAVFDLGSGTIKLNVSRLYVKSDLSKDLNFDASNFVIESCVHEAEEELRLGEMVLSSGDSSIPPIASQALTCAISKMIASAAAAGYRLGNEHQLDSGDVIPTVAAATAVYSHRLAHNGAAVLLQLQKLFKFPFVIVPHELEGSLGYVTAAAAVSSSSSQIVSLDVGGGSFQVCSPIVSSLHEGVGEVPELLMCNVAMGSSHAAQMLLGQRQQQCGAVSFQEMEILVAALASSISASSAARASAGSNVVDVEKMSQLCTLVDNVTIIGGSFCAGRMASLLLQRDDFSPEELFDCMRARLGMLSIDSIEKLGLPQPDIAIPKLCLLVAIMRTCGIKRCRYVRTLGNTPALLTMPQFWHAQ